MKKVLEKNTKNKEDAYSPAFCEIRVLENKNYSWGCL